MTVALQQQDRVSFFLADIGAVAADPNIEKNGRLCYIPLPAQDIAPDDLTGPYSTGFLTKRMFLTLSELKLKAEILF